MILAITYSKTTPTAYTDPKVVSINDRVMRAVRLGIYLVYLYPILEYVQYYLSTGVWYKEELTLFQSQVDIVGQQVVRRFILHWHVITNIFIGQGGSKIFVCQVYQEKEGINLHTLLGRSSSVLGLIPCAYATFFFFF